MQALLLWLVFMTVATLVTFLLAPSEAESIVRKRMREVRLRSADPDTVEEERLAEPFSRRVILPLLESLSRQLERITPAAGCPRQDGPQAAGGGEPHLAGPAPVHQVGPDCRAGRHRPGLVGTGSPGRQGGTADRGRRGLGAGGRVGPADFWVSRLGTQRRLKLARTLPDVFDLLSVSVEAGLGFDGAIQKVSEKFTDPTASEFGEYLKEVRLGKTREEALRNLAERTGLPELKGLHGRGDPGRPAGRQPEPGSCGCSGSTADAADAAGRGSRHADADQDGLPPGLLHLPRPSSWCCWGRPSSSW